MEPLIPLSFSPYRSRHSLSSHVRCALVTRGYTQNCKSIFSRTLWIILLEQIARPRFASATSAKIYALLRLRHDPEIWFRRFPALRITLLRLLVSKPNPQ